MRCGGTDEMAETLRRLVNVGSFSILQEKTERWMDEYHINTCDQNVARCCEIVELNARIQGQLFKLLSLVAAEGGVYGGAHVIKSRLLPWLGHGIFGSPFGLAADTSFSALAESAAKDREINDIQDMYEKSLQSVEEDLSVTRAEAEDLKAELEETKDELMASQRASTSDKMFTESELTSLRAKLRNAENEVATLRARSGLVDDYERQIRRLRDDISILTGRRDVLMSGSAALVAENKILRKQMGIISYYGRRIETMKEQIASLKAKHKTKSKSRSKKKMSLHKDKGDLTDSLLSYRYLPRPSSPLAADDVTQQVRQRNLIARFNDMFAQDRLDAMDILRRYSDDNENNQRIIFTVMEEAFTAAKLSFSQFKIKVRSNLATTHFGPETLEEAVQDYINRHTDLYDLPGLVNDVIRALNRNPKISLPPEISYYVIEMFIREACKLAWNMTSLAHSLDVAVATDAELYDDNKYRRSYDSEYTAPLVNHHIWPCLMQGTKVIMKGEANTRRGASLTPRRSRSPTRSTTPRPLSPSPSRARSRSPSPRRLTSGKGSPVASGRSSPVLRSLSPSRASSTPSRSVAASTSLSHYGVKS